MCLVPEEATALRVSENVLFSLLTSEFHTVVFGSFNSLLGFILLFFALRIFL